MPDPTDEPLDELPAIRSTEVRRVRGTTTLWRLYSMVDHPLPWNAFRHWGPASARWDPHPQGEPREHRDRAVHYSATSIVTALAEVFQQHRTIICAPGMRLVGYRLGRGVRMLDANGRWFTRAGASQSVVYGDPMRTQRWAAAITAANPDLDGIAYRSKLDPEQTCLALWFPAADALEQAAPLLDLPLDAPDLRGPIAAAADRIGYDLEVGRPTVWEG
jgi:hypothetical protein